VSGDTNTEERRLPEAAVGRLPVYLRVLSGLQLAGTEIVSSDQLAELAGVNAAKVRKDLSHLGSYGTRGVGYSVEQLQFQIARALGLSSDLSVAIVGLGNLGRALAGYRGFVQRGFRVVALFDTDPSLVGETVGELVVSPSEHLEQVCAATKVSIGVIAVPVTAAQVVADRMVSAGIASILNFAATVVNVPDHVSLRQVDLASELQILSYHQQRVAPAV
jgi:redox-sensing transcriptional repressor